MEQKQVVEVLGVSVNALTMADLNSYIVDVIRRGRKAIVAHHNQHSVYLYHRSPKIRAFFERADIVHVDGMSLVLIGKLLGAPLHREHRTTYVDWFNPLFRLAADSGWRVFYLGSKPSTIEQAKTIVKGRFPELVFSARSGFFDAEVDGEENLSVRAEINRFRPHLLLVGMGMPRQEHWIFDNLDDLDVNAILTSGAALDYLAGDIPTPPRWMGRIGLEWVFRLVSEPKRLWRRYLLEPWYLLGLFATSWIRRPRQRGA